MDGVDEALMSDSEMKALKDYNAMVLGKLAPYLSEEEKQFFKIKEKPVYSRRCFRMKKVLFVFNPCSGKAEIRKNLVDILQVFEKEGYNVCVHATKGKDDARKYVEKKTHPILI
jgi:hypothetical protein